MADSDRYDRGMRVRRSVLGDQHVDRASAQKTAFDDDFQTFITEGAWGSVWSRPGLTHRERSILCPSPALIRGWDWNGLLRWRISK